MAIDIVPDAPPLRTEVDGAVRIGSSRVLLELVINAFQEGATAEAIVQRFPTVTLADAYAVIAYYLRHRNELDQYVSERDRKGMEVRQEILATQGDLSDIRSRLHDHRLQSRMKDVEVLE
jgi:uncharacterized protein (DUF433 family)